MGDLSQGSGVFFFLLFNFTLSSGLESYYVLTTKVCKLGMKNSWQEFILKESQQLGVPVNIAAGCGVQGNELKLS